MSTLKGWEPLGDIVDKTCSQIGDHWGHHFGEMYSHAVDYLRIMNYDVVNTPKRVCLPVDPSLKRAYLPDDFVNYLGVGYVHLNDEIMLGFNPYMTRPCPDECGNETLGEGGLPQGTEHQHIDGLYPYWDSEDGYFGYNGNGAWAQKVFGWGGGYNMKGYYKVHKDKGYIDFNPDMPLTEVLLIYITNGFKPGIANMIPEMTFLAMQYYLRWQHYKMLSGISSGQAMREFATKAAIEEQQWRLQHRLAGVRQRAQPMYEIVAANRRSYGIQQPS